VRIIEDLAPPKPCVDIATKHLLCIVVLKEPNILFAGSRGDVTDGSWNLKGKKFFKPADFSSFGVVDLSGNRDNAQAVRLVDELLNSCANFHGMNLGPGMSDALRNMNDSVVVAATWDKRSETVQKCIEGAIEKAREFFLRDSSGFFRETKSFYSTCIRFGERLETCLVFNLKSLDWNERDTVTPWEEKDIGFIRPVRLLSCGLLWSVSLLFLLAFSFFQVLVLPAPGE
jgi:hypothetical protein